MLSVTLSYTRLEALNCNGDIVIKKGSYLPSHQYNTGFSRKTNKKIVLYELFSGQIIYSSGNKIIFAILVLNGPIFDKKDISLNNDKLTQ